MCQSLRWGVEGKNKAQSWGLCSGPFPSRSLQHHRQRCSFGTSRGKREQLSTISPALPRTRGLIQPHQASPRLTRPSSPWCRACSCLHTLPSPCGPALAGCSGSSGHGRGVWSQRAHPVPGHRCEDAADGRRCRPWHGAPAASPPSPGAPSPPPQMLLGTLVAGREPSPPAAGRAFVPVPPGPRSPGTGTTRRAPGSWIRATSPRQQWPDNSGKRPKMWV